MLVSYFLQNGFEYYPRHIFSWSSWCKIHWKVYNSWFGLIFCSLSWYFATIIMRTLRWLLGWQVLSKPLVTCPEFPRNYIHWCCCVPHWQNFTNQITHSTNEYNQLSQVGYIGAFIDHNWKCNKRFEYFPNSPVKSSDKSVILVIMAFVFLERFIFEKLVP